MATTYYPIAVNLKGKRALVVGGGDVSERKVKALLKAGAAVSVTSPTLTPRLKVLAKARRIVWRKKNVGGSDLAGVDIVIAATSEREINEKISVWARRRRVLINVVDQPRLSAFISPAVIRKGKAIIAVYTDGKDPVLSRDLKNFIEGHWDGFLSYRHRSQKSAA